MPRLTENMLKPKPSEIQDTGERRETEIIHRQRINLRTETHRLTVPTAITTVTVKPTTLYGS